MRNGLRVAAGNLHGFAADAFASLVSVGRMTVNLGNIGFEAPTLGSTRLLIIGSGPSLTQSLQTLKELDPRKICVMSVNDFYADSSFSRLRPSLHVLADPIYWDGNCFQSHAEPLLTAMRGLPSRTACQILQV